VILTAHAHNCQHCRPKPAVVNSKNKAHALALIARAKRVFVSTEGHVSFQVTKKVAIDRMKWCDERWAPKVAYHVDHVSAAFIR